MPKLQKIRVITDHKLITLQSGFFFKYGTGFLADFFLI